MIPKHLYTIAFPTGSNYICDPPVTDTDIDMMFYVEHIEDVQRTLHKLGWTSCDHSEGYDGYDDWRAYRKGNENALITTNLQYFNRFYQATELAKKKNLLNKEDRIKLFEEVTQRPRKEKKQKEVRNTFEEWYNQYTTTIDWTLAAQQPATNTTQNNGNNTWTLA